jgi:glutathione-regulated potassium-efflux system ancillary protein KefG
MSILVQFIHPYPERSRANRALLHAIANLPGVTVNDLYARYPNFYVDVEREQKLLVAAQLVVFQHPLYWYSSPALLKEWIDVVLAYGFAYGTGGRMLRGKTWLHSVTTGMPGESYAAEGFNGAGIEELLKPFESTARLCGMHWLEPAVLHDAHAISDEKLVQQCGAFRARLMAAIASSLGAEP